MECGVESDELANGWRAYLAEDDDEEESRVLMFARRARSGSSAPSVGTMRAGFRQERHKNVRMERTGESIAGRHDETKWALLTTEFWAMLGLIVATLIAAAVSDSLNDVRAWTLVTVIGAAYIVSRGLAKSGTDHDAPTRGRRRR
jgi:hypothetical protein